MKLSKDNIKGLLSRRSKEITVSGYEIRIIEMTIPQQLEVEKALKDKSSNADLLFPVLRFSVVDEHDQPLLDDASISLLPASVAATIFKQCIELNSITEQELERRAKNL